MLRKITVPALSPAISIATLFISRAFATDWSYLSQGSLATELTGGYGAVADPSDGSVYNDGYGDYSYPVILDSGSSGFLMSETVTDEFNVPLQSGQTYTETGIGGNETENVTEPLISYYAPASDSNPDDTSTMTAYGTYTFESRQNDPFEGLIFFDIIGTPVIQKQVMVANPNQSYNIVQDTLGFLTAETTLQASDPVLPSKGLYHVPITWTNFVTGPTVPSEGPNPVVNGVTARGPSDTDVANNWLFDSGAQFTIISPTYAAQLGVNMNDPTTTIQGQGVGGSTVTFDGFQITDIALPLSNGDRLVFKDPTVYVPVDTTLPAGLTGVLGENLFMQATDGIDPDTGEPTDTYNPLFSEWYLDGPGSQLVLYDPNSTYNALGAASTTIVWNNAGGPGDGHTWDIALSENWNASSALAVYSDGDSVIFNDSNSGNYAVTLSTTVSPTSVTVNNSDGNYIFSGSGTIAGTGSLTKTGTGNLTLATANTFSGGTTVSAGILFVAVNNALPSGGKVSVNGGTVILDAALSAGATTITAGEIQLAPDVTLGSGATTSNVNFASLSITGNGVLDLTNNHIIISYTAGSDPIATIASYIASGYNKGHWNGPGIISSTARNPTNGLLYGLGYADGNDFVVKGLASGYIEIKYTLLGDANLDGVVNGADFSILAANFGLGVTNWDQGNFLYGPSVNGADFAALAANFGQGDSGADLTGDLAALQAFAAANGLLADLPEPGSLAILAFAGALTLRRARATRFL
jgi:autotransporter-associated beta strand protein